MTVNQSVEPMLASIAKAERHMKSEYGTHGLADGWHASKPKYGRMIRHHPAP